MGYCLMRLPNISFATGGSDPSDVRMCGKQACMLCGRSMAQDMQEMHGPGDAFSSLASITLTAAFITVITSLISASSGEYCGYKPRRPG